LDAYRYAVQKPNETLENFMYRFNDLAQAAQLDLSQPKIWLDHYLDWCEKLHDPITSQQYISLNFPSKNELAKYVITRESRSVREDFLKATTEKERRKTTPRPHQVYTMTSTDTASIDMTSESSHTTAYSYNYSDISEIETAQVMALKSMGKIPNEKNFAQHALLNTFYLMANVIKPLLALCVKYWAIQVMRVFNDANSQNATKPSIIIKINALALNFVLKNYKPLKIKINNC